MLNPECLATLIQFRQELYESLGLRQDSLFELVDAALTAPHRSTLVRLLTAAFRRPYGRIVAERRTVLTASCADIAAAANGAFNWAMPLRRHAQMGSVADDIEPRLAAGMLRTRRA